MENLKNPSPEGYIKVRYNRTYSISMLVYTVILILFGLFFGNMETVNYAALFIAPLFCFNGIYGLSGRKYMSYDPHGKKINIYGLVVYPIRKFSYDKLFVSGKDLYREINGKKKYISISRIQCNKQDLNLMFEEINKIW